MINLINTNDCVNIIVFLNSENNVYILKIDRLIDENMIPGRLNFLSQVPYVMGCALISAKYEKLQSDFEIHSGLLYSFERKYPWECYEVISS